jgi:hypothetical protein
MIVENLETGTYVECCPLCGDNAYLHTETSSRKAQFWVKCDNLSCRCTTVSFESDRQALDAWNQRVPAEVTKGR